MLDYSYMELEAHRGSEAGGDNVEFIAKRIKTHTLF